MPGGGNWVGPVSSGIPFGFGMVVIYFSANAYIIDAFPGYVASALAAKTVVRSGSGAAMPLFITAMYHNLGNGWAASVWAFISLAMVSACYHHGDPGSDKAYFPGSNTLPFLSIWKSYSFQIKKSYFGVDYLSLTVVSSVISHCAPLNAQKYSIASKYQ